MRNNMQSGTLDDLANYLEDQIAQAGGVMSACNTSGMVAKPEEIEGEEAIMAGGFSEDPEWIDPERFHAMRRGWKYELPEDISSKLRSQIEGDDALGVQSTLQEAVAWCYDNIPGAEDDRSLESIQDDLEMYSPDDEEEEDDFENLNYLLDEFFDYCDIERIWVGGI